MQGLQEGDGGCAAHPKQVSLLFVLMSCKRCRDYKDGGCDAHPK